MFIKYELLDRFINDLRVNHFSIKLIKLIKIDIPKYEQIYCCIECILNGIKIYIFILGNEFSSKKFFYGEQKNSLNSWFIKTDFNTTDKIKFIIDKNESIENYKILKEQYNLFAKKFTREDIDITNNVSLFKILLKYTIGNINYKKIKYGKIIDFFISEYKHIYPIFNNAIERYMDILNIKLHISYEDIYNITLNMLLNFHINEKDMERETVYINHIEYILLDLIKFNIKITGLIINFIKFMRDFNMQRSYITSPVLINLNIIEDVNYNGDDDGTCDTFIMEEEEEEEETTLSKYLDDNNKLLFILPGNKLFCTTKAELIQWITTITTDEYGNENNYRIFYHSINNKIKKDYYVLIPTIIGNKYILCSYIYIILLSQTRVFQFEDVENNIELKEVNRYKNIENTSIVKCSRVKKYDKIQLLKIK